MDSVDELLQVAEADADEQEEAYVYSKMYSVCDEYVSDYPIIKIVDKEIQDMSKEISIAGETGSQYLEFQVDRFQDGIDLNDMTLHISYIKNDVGDEDRPVNVRYNSNSIIFGWIISSGATNEAGTLQVGIWAGGEKYSNNYLWKTKPKSYTINEGVVTASKTVNPAINWYLQFSNLMDEKVQEANKQLKDIEEAKEAIAKDYEISKSEIEQLKTDTNKIKQETQKISDDLQSDLKEYAKTTDVKKTVDEAIKNNLNGVVLSITESGILRASWED